MRDTNRQIKRSERWGRIIGNLRPDIQANTQLITDVLERTVRQYPEQWFGVHKRGKKYYPDLYSAYQLRRQRRKQREAHREQRMVR